MIENPVDRVKLVEARKRLGLTQKELHAAARKRGFKMSHNWLANVESGRQGARPDQLAILADVLRVPVKDLQAPPDPGHRGAVAYLMERVVDMTRRLERLELESQARRAAGG